MNETECLAASDRFISGNREIFEELSFIIAALKRSALVCKVISEDGIYFVVALSNHGFRLEFARNGPNTSLFRVELFVASERDLDHGLKDALSGQRLYAGHILLSDKAVCLALSKDHHTSTCTDAVLAAV